jgi:hypothetical protein
VLVDEPFAGAAESALHLVGNEQPLLALADFLQPAQVFQARDVDPALALDRLHHDGRHAAVVLRDRAHGIEVVQGHAHEARYQGLEAGLHLAAARRR